MDEKMMPFVSSYNLAVIGDEAFKDYVGLVRHMRVLERVKNGIGANANRKGITEEERQSLRSRVGEVEDLIQGLKVQLSDQGEVVGVIGDQERVMRDIETAQVLNHLAMH